MGTKRLSFCTAANCKVDPCWRVMKQIGSCWHSVFSTFHSFGTYSDNSLSGSIKFFPLKIALGLALGESWPLLVQPQKNTHNGTYWRMLALSFLHISFIGTYWDNSFGDSTQVLSFENSP